MLRVYRRRVQRIGSSTYIVSLPTLWAKEIGLEPKMEAVLEILPDLSIRLYIPSKHMATIPKEYVVTINANYNVHDVVREIIAGYVAGARNIKILHKGVRREIVDEAVILSRERLMGLEVIDEDVSSTTLQIVVDPNLSDIVSVMKRMIRIAASMHEDIATYIENTGDRGLLEAVIARDNLVDKLYLLALRQLINILMDPYEMGRRGISYIDSIYMSLFIKSVERFADHAVNISLTLLNLAEVPKYLLELYRGAIEMFKRVAEAFIAIDKESAVKTIREVERLKTVEEEIRKVHGENMAKQPSVSRVLDAISRILARSIDIAEEVIDITAVKSIATLHLTNAEVTYKA
ncbi:MAG: phosphate uptake regulator PhoU [Ignisphaera sp.]|nr:phosphate uptake regulator PhoU [Ignisphaera sp.]MDW8084959.1 phosphate uptake regulator PhoU [Ignisphaera sp.]